MIQSAYFSVIKFFNAFFESAEKIKIFIPGFQRQYARADSSHKRFQDLHVAMRTVEILGSGATHDLQQKSENLQVWVTVKFG